MREIGVIRQRLFGPDASLYVGYGRQLLGVVKAQMKAGGLLQYRLTKEFPDGTTVTAISRLGQDEVIIRRPEPEVQPVIKKKPSEDSNLHLLIMYSGNKVAAVPMEQLEKLNLKATYKATLSQSNWGTTRLKVAQFNFDSEVYDGFFVAPFSLKEVVRASTNHQVTVRKKQNLLDSVTTTTPRDDKPLCNGKADMIYTPYDSYRVGSESVTSTGSYKADFGTSTYPYAISEEGKYYFAITSRADFALYDSQFNIMNTDAIVAPYVDIGLFTPADNVLYVSWYYMDASGQAGAEITYGMHESMNAVLQAARSQVGPLKFTSYYSTYQNGVHGIEYKMGVGQYSVPADYSLNLPLAVYSNNNDSKDTMAVTFAPFVGGYMFTNDIHFEEATGKYLGYSYRFLDIDIGSTYIRLESFPPGLDANVRNYTKSKHARADEYMVRTPYSSRIGEFEPWFHISNGKHFMQGFHDTQNRIYLNNTDASGLLRETTGGDISDIQAVLMDVPLKIIKALK
mgnify:CR=1 FL=1